MESKNIRNVITIIVSFIAMWYVGAMFNFFPFIGNYLIILGESLKRDNTPSYNNMFTLQVLEGMFKWESQTT